MNYIEKLIDTLQRIVRMCDTVKNNPNYDRVNIADIIKKLANETLKDTTT